MKTIIGMMLFAGLTAGAINSADAQRGRGRDNGGRSGGESNAAPQRQSRGNFSENGTFRQNTVTRNNSYTPVQRNVRSYTPNNAVNSRVYPQRNAITRNDVRANSGVNVTRPNNNAVVSSGFNRNRIYSTRNSNYYPNRTSNYRYNNSSYRYNGRNYRGNNYY